jgi:hypothetical protein
VCAFHYILPGLPPQRGALLLMKSESAGKRRHEAQKFLSGRYMGVSYACFLGGKIGQLNHQKGTCARPRKSVGVTSRYHSLRVNERYCLITEVIAHLRQKKSHSTIGAFVLIDLRRFTSPLPLQTERRLPALSLSVNSREFRRPRFPDPAWPSSAHEADSAVL